MGRGALDVLVQVAAEVGSMCICNLASNRGDELAK